MRKLLRDPLTHFLLLGGLIFFLFSWRGTPESTDPHRIVISDEELDGIRQSLAILRGQPPSRDDIWEALEPSVKDEILFREAVALGLDQDDALIRARLTEKMLFLTQDLAEPAAPTDAEIAAFFNADPSRFRKPTVLSFEQIYFSPSRHGADLEAVVVLARDRLMAGSTEIPDGDDVLFEFRYNEVNPVSIARGFGTAFAEAIVDLPSNSSWQGPLRSDFGMHLVRVLDIVEAYQPDFDAIRAEVTSALTTQRRLEANEAEYQKLRQRYEIVINLSADPELAIEPGGNSSSTMEAE
jgi:peptidyl-prolyl cis-trans isomerase C